jgi:hypothetical protein
MESQSNLVRFLRSHRSALLIFALVAEMVISRIADYHPRSGALLAVFAGLLLLAAASYMANKKVVKLVVLPIAILWLVARLLEAFGNRQHADARLAPAPGLALSIAVLWAIFLRVRSVPQTTDTTIAEAFMGYLIMGTAFAQLYWILNQVMSKPFNQVIPSYEISTLLYFSMVTMTSVGYGGIVPINPYVRMVAAFESVAGIFYIAVVVARLVSSYRTAEPPQE